MEENKYLIGYIERLCSKDTPAAVIGRNIKIVFNYLNSGYEYSRSGYKKYLRDFALEIANNKYIKSVLLDFLYIGKKGFQRKKKEVEKIEKLPKVKKENLELLSKFAYYLNSNFDFSPNTNASYITSVKLYFEYEDTFSSENIKHYIIALEQQGMKPATINLRITGLERFGQFLGKKLNLKRAKVQKSLSTDNIPSENEYKKICEYLIRKNDMRLYLQIRTLASTGARISELLQFTWQHIIDGEVVLKGKGNKYRRFFFPKQLQDAVKNYIPKSDFDESVMSGGKYGIISSRAFNMKLKGIAKKCNISLEKMHAHAFRHYFAKMFLKSNKDIVALSDILGHESIDTTKIYLQKSYAEQKKDFNKIVKW